MAITAAANNTMLVLILRPLTVARVLLWFFIFLPFVFGFLSQFIRSKVAPLLVHAGYFPARFAGKWWSQRRSLRCSQLLTRNVSSRLLTGEKRKSFRKVKILF